LAAFTFPVLARLAGTHGGDDFEKLAEPEAVSRFVAARPAADYYVSEYVPYESADSYFRKYRLIFVGGQVLPYHLAIADQWKVHHFRTDMANQAALRAEEEAFLADPTKVFGPAQFQALNRVREVLDLDYGGIDCALDADGNVVVFEANATML